MMKITFSISDAGSCLEGTLVYVPTDYAFVFHATRKPDEHSSLQIGLLQLAVDYDGVVLYPYGVCGLVRHRDTDLTPPAVNRPGILVADTGTELIPGVAYRLGAPTDWPIWINKRRGWVCLGDPHYKMPVEAIEFATTSICVLSAGRLVAVWLHPEALPELPPGVT
jgi:hypothetical protein